MGLASPTRERSPPEGKEGEREAGEVCPASAGSTQPRSREKRS
jgi:hypothetical protein